MNPNATRKTPLDRLLTDFLPQGSPVAEALDAQVRRIHEPPKRRTLAELQRPAYGNDPDELLQSRFICRGGLALLAGPTGIGKSSFLMQAAIHWAIGKPFFGICPGDVFQQFGMRILLVQAENDDGDLYEMAAGVVAGCADLTEADRKTAFERIIIPEPTCKSGDEFAGMLDAMLAELGTFDLVIIDPAFAYLGGDGNSQKDVSHFMRELITPLAQKHGVGILIIHHTNKPLNGREKNTWAAGDYAYLGAGSAEWINPARAALALRSIGSDAVFELRAVKRGRRLGWRDENGQPTTVQHIAHHGEPGVICWRRATPEEVADVQAATDTGTGRRRAYEAAEALHAVKAYPNTPQAFYVQLISEKLRCGGTTAKRLLRDCVGQGWLLEGGDARFRRYRLSETGADRAARQPSTVQWVAKGQN
jgi:hypothetical protein